MKKTFRKCPECEGRGKAVYDCGTPVFEPTCHRCKGRGKIPAAPWKRKVVSRSKANNVHVRVSIINNGVIRGLTISAEKRIGPRAMNQGFFSLSPAAAKKLARTLEEGIQKLKEGYE